MLELGCAGGGFTKRLTILDCKLVAIDLSLELIKKAKEEVGFNNVSFIVADIENLPFKDGIFDVISGNSILHHIKLTTALKQINRVLRTEGKVWFSEPNLVNPQVFISLKLSVLRQKLGISPNEIAFVRWRLKKAFQVANFKKIVVNNYDFLHPSIPARFILHAKKIGSFLEKVPLIKEVSGSIVITAQK